MDNPGSAACGSVIVVVLTLFCNLPIFEIALIYVIKAFINESYVIRFMVDAADRDKLDAARNELHTLMDKTQLAGIPVLVLGNKRDLPGALTEVELIEALSLRTIPNREICCYSISCKEQDNIGSF